MHEEVLIPVYTVFQETLGYKIDLKDSKRQKQEDNIGYNSKGSQSLTDFVSHFVKLVA